MSITVEGKFNPLRLKIERRQPVQFAAHIRNKGGEEKRLTVKVILSSSLAFTKGGFKNTELKRVDSIKPGEEKILYFDLFPKFGISPGEEAVKIRVQEHNANYEYTKNQHEVDFWLTVE